MLLQPRFKKFVLDELTVARKRSVCMMVLGGVFEDDPEKPSKRGPPLNKFETRGLFTHKAPAKPVQFTKMPVMLAEAGMTVEEPAKGGARVKTPQAAKRPDTAEEAEEKPEDTKVRRRNGSGRGGDVVSERNMLFSKQAPLLCSSACQSTTYLCTIAGSSS